ncbi:MAG TPA: polyphenol oxidase family protein [Candidatus Babeliales bacterium]|nr:polyphenol oxidase family protein [Candidatus Babeliales bacterium]
MSIAVRLLKLMYIIDNKNRFAIYFGGEQDQFYPAIDKSRARFLDILKPHMIEMGITVPYFLHQTHSILGKLLVTQKDVLENNFLMSEGDFLVTSLPSVGLGVLTADCLPIVIYDPKSHSIATIHAGWRGSLLGILKNAILVLLKQNNSSISGLKFYFGPCARVCCYQVSKEFLENLEEYEFKNRVIECRNGEIYFDLVLFNLYLLESLGASLNFIDLSYSLCTICTSSFFSHRRQGISAGRNITLATLSE